jgi:hypothetical protein
MAEEFKEIKEESARYRSRPIEEIDQDYIKNRCLGSYKDGQRAREEFLERRNQWTMNWRDLNPQAPEGPWENSSNFHVPMTLTYGKSIHARLWQLFSDEANFFGVKAKREAFESKEPAIKSFMQYILSAYANDRTGTRDVFDEWLWDNVFEGSGYLKLYWGRIVNEYTEIVPVLEVQDKFVIDPANVTGVTESETKLIEKEEDRVEVLETPHIKRILLEDVVMPVGHNDPHTAPWVGHNLYMTDEDLKVRAESGKFIKEQVEKAITYRVRVENESDTEFEIKRDRRRADGYFDDVGYRQDEQHIVVEWYGKAYVTPEYNQTMPDDLKKLPREVVVWIHYASGEILGWTYLKTISPSGIRPIFKADFIRFPNRENGVGVAEALDSIQRNLNAMYNLRMDAGTLSSLPFGVYRSSSGLKPDKILLQPGTLHPVDDVNADIKLMSFPYLGSFGQQEENNLMSYGEKLLNVSELTLGGTPQKVGLFRTASGASAVQQELSIQLEIHFDRIARCLSKLFKCLFVMCRERISDNFFYRVTGERGEPIFGRVQSRQELAGDYDFEINVDVMGQSQIAQQQQATLLMQTLINPAFTQTGIVGPEQLYHLARNYLLKNKVKRIDNYIATPPQYQGEVITPAERIYRILVGVYMDPAIEDTVRMNENHETALKVYDGFKNSNQFGLFNDDQIMALERVIEKHNQMLLATQQAGSMPNVSGMQTPRDGLEALAAEIGGGQGTLGAPTGEVNGPVL